MARLMAKAVNCIDPQKKPCGACENCRSITEESHMDVIEIDAASNNGVDDVREHSILYYPGGGAGSGFYSIGQRQGAGEELFKAKYPDAKQ